MQKHELPKRTLADVQKMLVLVRATKPKTSIPILNTSTLKPLDDDITRHKVRSLSDAIQALPKQSLKNLSNVLSYRTTNQHLKPLDFQNLWDIKSSEFDIPEVPKIFLIRARNGDNLTALGVYFLIFESENTAAAYLIDTLGKKLNGTNLYLEMVDVERQKKFMESPILSEVVKVSNNKIINIEQTVPRERCVLVKGFPTFITRDTIEQMLWSYDLDYKNTPIRLVEIDNFAGIGMWLIVFSNDKDPERFVKEFHGVHFNNEERLPKVFAAILD